MSIFIDKLFIQRLAPRLSKFKQKSEFLWNFRCPICGDSKKNPHKARGFVYRQKSNLFYSCKNCGASHTVGTLIKILDHNLYREYLMERFKNESKRNTPDPNFDLVKGVNTNKLIPSQILEQSSQSISKSLPSILDLKEDHYARQYIKNRKIPKDKWNNIFYTMNFKELVRRCFPNHNIKTLYDNDHRIVLPFYDEEKHLIGFQGRSLDEKPKIKYITIKANEDIQKIYGLHNLDKSKTIYVVEGPIDSMFIDNSIAMMDASLYNVIPILGDLDYVFIFDNEKRNPDIVKRMETTINMGQKICIFPSNIQQKDINEMIISGFTIPEIHRIIDTHTFSDIRATLEFSKWKNS